MIGLIGSRHTTFSNLWQLFTSQNPDFEPCQNLNEAYQDLQIKAPCFGTFNGKVLYSTDTLDEIYIKVIGMTKLEYEEYEKRKQEEYKRKEAEFKAQIPQLIKEYRERARGIIPEENLEYWDEIVPNRLNDLYRGIELDCWLDLIKILNDKNKSQKDKLYECLLIFRNQGHSGMSAWLVFSGLKYLHPLGEVLVSYITNSWQK